MVDQRQGSDDPQTPEEREPGHYRFAQRWMRRREERSSKAMWVTLGLDLVLLGMIVFMVWVAFRAWQ